MTLDRRRLLAAGGTLAALPVAGLFWPATLAPAESTRGEFPEFTKRSRAAIKKGFDWLLKTYNRDDGCGEDIGTPSDISCSAVVALALLAQGNSTTEGPLAKQVARSESYLRQIVRRNLFVVNLNSQVRADLCAYADHHFAALALSQMLGEGADGDGRIRRDLERVVRTVSHAQSQVGDWGPGRYPQLASVTGWCSLRAAYLAGMQVQASARKTAEYLIRSMQGQIGQNNLFVNAAGIRVLFAMDLQRKNIAVQALDWALQQATSGFPSFAQFGGEHYLGFHFINDVMLQWGGDYWRRWFPGVRDKLCQVQNRDGSWTGYSCIVSRTFCTALALLVLTSPNRYLPISSR